MDECSPDDLKVCRGPVASADDDRIHCERVSLISTDSRLPQTATSEAEAGSVRRMPSALESAQGKTPETQIP